MKHYSRHSWVMAALLISFQATAWAQENAIPASSALDTFTSRAIIQVLIVAFLVIGLLGGGMLILNLGLLSKRREDRVGGRNPSDVGILKSTVWPESPTEDRILPAEEEDEEDLEREREGGGGRAA